MPIGTIIGWLIAQFLFGLAVIVTNQKSAVEGRPISVQLTRNVVFIFGSLIFYTASGGLLGTIIELIVR